MFSLGQTGLNNKYVLKESDQLTVLRWGRLYLGGRGGEKRKPFLSLLLSLFCSCSNFQDNFAEMLAKQADRANRSIF